MCGIAGLLFKRGPGPIGKSMTAMLQALQHRGPDSTGFALYREPQETTTLWLRVDENRSRAPELVKRWKHHLLLERTSDLGAEAVEWREVTPFCARMDVRYEGSLKSLVDTIEEDRDLEVLGAGRSMELIKDVGLADEVARKYGLDSYQGTHAIGHVRMTTESVVDITHSHPFWAYPFSDIAVVHNGQLTNYWTTRRLMEAQGHRFRSNCDSELIAVYVADKLSRGYSLEDALRASIDDLDGVFTYFVSTPQGIGVAKDSLAAKPLVVFQNEELVALASEEIAIRAILPQEIRTWDPYEGEVFVWEKVPA